jgi:hypothetical protein
VTAMCTKFVWQASRGMVVLHTCIGEHHCVVDSSNRNECYCFRALFVVVDDFTESFGKGEAPSLEENVVPFYK